MTTDESQSCEACNRAADYRVATNNTANDRNGAYLCKPHMEASKSQSADAFDQATPDVGDRKPRFEEVKTKMCDPTTTNWSRRSLYREEGQDTGRSRDALRRPGPEDDQRRRGPGRGL